MKTKHAQQKESGLGEGTSEAHAYQKLRRAIKRHRRTAQKRGDGNLVSICETLLNEFNHRHPNGIRYYR